MPLGKQHTNRFGLQKKVVIAILIAGFLALAIGLLVTYFETRKVLTRAIGSNFAEIAKKTAERFDVTVKDEISTFQRLAQDPVFIAAVKEEKREDIETYLVRSLRFAEEKEEHLAFFVVNEKGQIIAGSNIEPWYGVDQSDEEWWRVTYGEGKGRVYVSNITIDPLTGHRVFDIGVPIADASTGTVVGGIRGMMNVDVFFRFINEMNFAGTGHGMLVDSGGTPLICPILPLVEHSMNPKTVDLITGKAEGWDIAEDDAHGGRDSIIGFSPIEFINSLGPESLGGNRWYTFVRQDPEETFAPVNSLILKVFLVESGIVLLICVSGFYIMRRLFIKPMDTISSGVEQIGKGDFGSTIDISTGDEFEFLAEGFNRMSEAVKGLYENLEVKIKDRTIELERTKNYLESILKYSGDMIITTDLEARIVTFNEGAERMLGYRKEEVIGTSIAEYYLHREDRAKISEIIDRGVMITNYETQLVTKDGKAIDISLSLSLLRDENGRVIGTVGISKDITEWKLAQSKLKEYSHELESMVEKRTHELEEISSHLEAMLSGIADGVIFTDQDNRMTFINDAAEVIFNITRDGWLGRDYKECHSAEAHEKSIQLIRDMRDGKIKSYTAEIRSGDKIISACFSPILHGAEYLGVIFIARDITEIKRLQHELLETEKLALVGKMSSSIAHEIRNPLVPIGGFARLLSKRMGKDPSLKKYVDIIIGEIDRLERLLHDFLYFTKEIKPVIKPLNLNETINELLFFYNVTLTDHDISLQVELSPDLPVTPADASEIKQVLINLLSNAVHAMTDGGTLTVKSMVERKGKKLYSVISIGDTGSGIAEDVRKSMFDPFFTTKIHGLGLGLTLTKNIVEAHGGSIEVRSNLNEGSTFIIALPI